MTVKGGIPWNKGKKYSKALTETAAIGAPLKAYADYKMQVRHCEQRVSRDGSPIEMRMTFAQWWNVWLKSNHYEQRGTGSNEYCMARTGDLGHYEAGNVHIITNRENLAETSVHRKAWNKGKSSWNKGLKGAAYLAHYQAREGVDNVYGP